MTSFLLSATNCWPMQDQSSQMRIMFFARTGEKLQAAQGPWLVPLQGLAQGLVEASSFCELKHVFIKHYFKKYTQYLSEKCFAWNVHIPKSQKNKHITPEDLLISSERRENNCLMHACNSQSHCNHFHLSKCVSNLLYKFPLHFLALHLVSKEFIVKCFVSFKEPAKFLTHTHTHTNCYRQIELPLNVKYHFIVKSLKK